MSFLAVVISLVSLQLPLSFFLTAASLVCDSLAPVKYQRSSVGVEAKKIPVHAFDAQLSDEPVRVKHRGVNSLPSGNEQPVSNTHSEFILGSFPFDSSLKNPELSIQKEFAPASNSLPAQISDSTLELASKGTALLYHIR